MHRLALVELGVDASSVLLALEVAQHEERLDDAAVLLERLGERVLPRRGLQARDEQRGGNPAVPDGPQHQVKQPL